MHDNAELQRIEQEIRSEDARTLTERASRLMHLARLNIVPSGPFAYPSTECVDLFRDGYFFGCITLAQAVTDAIIRHIHWAEFPNVDRKKFVNAMQRIRELQAHGVISDDVKAKVERIWQRRNEFHHLDPSSALGHRALEELAQQTLALLSEVEAEFFGYTVDQGNIIPNKPKYLDIKDGRVFVFVRKR